MKNIAVVIKAENFHWKLSNITNNLKELSVSNSDMDIDCRLFLSSHKMYDDRTIFSRFQETLSKTSNFIKYKTHSIFQIKDNIITTSFSLIWA